MESEPVYLPVGTEVSAKYKGAFCEAKIKAVAKKIKCRITFKHPGLNSCTISDELIKPGSTIRINGVIESKHPDKNDNKFYEATIIKIFDCSEYTVVYDDGDVATLKRTSLCLKSGKHFAESHTLDKLPLTHPEHFGNPVQMPTPVSRKSVRRKPAGPVSKDNDSGDEQSEGEDKNDTESDSEEEVPKDTPNKIPIPKLKTPSSRRKIVKGETPKVKVADPPIDSPIVEPQAAVPRKLSKKEEPPVALPPIHIKEITKDVQDLDNKKSTIKAKTSKKRIPQLPLPPPPPPPDIAKEEVQSLESANDSATDEDDEGKISVKNTEGIAVGQKLRVRYGKGKLVKVYEAKVMKMEYDPASNKPKYWVHYTGWNTRYDEWIQKGRIVEIVDEKSGKKKKGQKLSDSSKDTTPLSDNPPRPEEEEPEVPDSKPIPSKDSKKTSKNIFPIQPAEPSSPPAIPPPVIVSLPSHKEADTTSKTSKNSKRKQASTPKNWAKKRRSQKEDVEETETFTLDKDKSAEDDLKSATASPLTVSKEESIADENLFSKDTTEDTQQLTDEIVSATSLSSDKDEDSQEKDENTLKAEIESKSQKIEIVTNEPKKMETSQPLAKGPSTDSDSQSSSSTRARSKGGKRKPPTSVTVDKDRIEVIKEPITKEIIEESPETKSCQDERREKHQTKDIPVDPIHVPVANKRRNSRGPMKTVEVVEKHIEAPKKKSKQSVDVTENKESIEEIKTEKSPPTVEPKDRPTSEQVDSDLLFCQEAVPASPVAVVDIPTPYIEVPIPAVDGKVHETEEQQIQAGDRLMHQLSMSDDSSSSFKKDTTQTHTKDIQSKKGGKRKGAGRRRNVSNSESAPGDKHETSGRGGKSRGTKPRARAHMDSLGDSSRLSPSYSLYPDDGRPLTFNYEPQSEYNFLQPLEGPTADARITELQSRISQLRKTFYSLKSDLAALDRRRKRCRVKQVTKSNSPPSAEAAESAK